MDVQLTVVSRYREQTLDTEGVFRNFDTTVKVMCTDNVAAKLMDQWQKKTAERPERIASTLDEQMFLAAEPSRLFAIVVGFPHPFPGRLSSLKDEGEKISAFSNVMHDPGKKDPHAPRVGDNDGAEEETPTEAELWIYSLEAVRDEDFARLQGHPWVTEIGKAELEAVCEEGEEVEVPPERVAEIEEERAFNRGDG